MDRLVKQGEEKGNDLNSRKEPRRKSNGLKERDSNRLQGKRNCGKILYRHELSSSNHKKQCAEGKKKS